MRSSAARALFALIVAMRPTIPAAAQAPGVVARAAARPSGAAARKAARESAQARAAQLRDFDAFLAKGLKDWDIPGLSVSVVKNDSVIFAKGYGVRTLGMPGAVDDQTLFGIMSTTKAFTAMALAMLVDEHRLSWNDPVTKWLPELEFPDPLETRELTVKDLLTHNTGLGNADLLWTRSDLSREEILRRVRFLTPAYSIRDGFVYQNVMYAAAGEVVARASGMPWEDFIRTRIFGPLGMTRSYTTLENMRATHDQNVSSPHFMIRDTIRVIDDEPADAIEAAGAIWSTASDMAKWMRFLLDSGRVNGTRLVSEQNFHELFRAQAVGPPGGFYPTSRIIRPHRETYGFGFFEEDYRGRFVAYHTGSLAGRTAIIGLMPDEGVGVYVFGNLDHAEFRHAVMYKAFDLFAGTAEQPARDWSAEFLTLYGDMHRRSDSVRTARDAQRVPGTHPSLALDRYAGTYTHPAWGSLVIAMDTGALRMTLGVGPQNTGLLEHWNYDTFRATMGDGRSGGRTLTFALDPSGRVASVMLDGSAQYVFARERAAGRR
jgi:CubicO group peptidase (beta-lactamase class C family)